MGKVIENPGRIVYPQLRSRVFRGFEEDRSDDVNRQNALRSFGNSGEIEVGVINGVKYIKTFPDKQHDNFHYFFYLGDVYVLDQANGPLVSDINVHFYTGKGNHPDYNYMALKGPNRSVVERVGQEIEAGWVKPTHGGIYSTPLIPNDDLKGLSELEVVFFITENIKKYEVHKFEYPNTILANFIWEKEMK